MFLTDHDVSDGYESVKTSTRIGMSTPHVDVGVLVDGLSSELDASVGAEVS